MSLTKSERRQRIKFRIRKVVSGNAAQPRLSDVNGTTLAAASSREAGVATGTKIETAAAVGKLIAERALQAGITTINFDRGGNLYHGRVKSLAEGAREAGLKF